MLLSFLVSTLLLALPGAASSSLADSPWPVFHGDARGTGFSAYNTSGIDGAILWTFRTESQIETSPVIGADGTIYIGDHACNLYAVNPDGTQKWKFNGGDPITSKEWGGLSCMQASPAVAADGTVYIVTMSNWLFAVSPEGREKWRYRVYTFKDVWSSPAIGPDGTVYVGSEVYPVRESGKPQEIGGTLYAITPAGKKKWAYDSGSATMQSTSVFLKDGTILNSAGDMDQELGTFVSALLAFRPDGTIRWKFRPKDKVIEASPVVGDDDTIYIGVKGKYDPREGVMYALTSEGQVKWSFDLDGGMSVSPAIDREGNLYFGDWEGLFYALDRNGKELWRAQTPQAYEALSSSPALSADGILYFGSTAGYFFAYTTSGKELWRFWTPFGGIISSPAIGKDKVVYIAAVSGELFAVGDGGGSGKYLPRGPEDGNGAWEIREDDCPHHIYGTAESGFYGAYDMIQKDLTQSDLVWIKANCLRTTWPEHMLGFEWQLREVEDVEASPGHAVREDGVGTLADRMGSPSVCGNGICEEGESGCHDDCGDLPEERNKSAPPDNRSLILCGNGICEEGEYDCDDDCGGIPVKEEEALAEKLEDEGFIPGIFRFFRRLFGFG